jgi:hypothetical protein
MDNWSYKIKLWDKSVIEVHPKCMDNWSKLNKSVIEVHAKCMDDWSYKIKIRQEKCSRSILKISEPEFSNWCRSEMIIWKFSSENKAIDRCWYKRNKFLHHVLMALHNLSSFRKDGRMNGVYPMKRKIWSVTQEEKIFKFKNSWHDGMI